MARRVVKERYWLRVGGLPWREVNKKEFIVAEGVSGFRSKSGPGTLAAAGFSVDGRGGDSMEGRITRGKITKKAYGWDQEFFKAVTATK